MRNKLIFSLAAFVLVGVVAGYYFVTSSEAQRNTSITFEYAVIQGSYKPYPVDSVSSVSSAVNICYLRTTGCQNEEVRSDLNISKFLQDERLENQANSKLLAGYRAQEIAFSNAIAKLGKDGWEMLDSPDLTFDLYYTNPEGIRTASKTASSGFQHIWFKRERQ